MLAWFQEFITNKPEVFAAFMSMVATAFAAWATWRGPISAARLAEEIRKSAERESESRRMKLQIFSTLMQERATIYSDESVRMLNSIDFIFVESAKVREAWADLYVIFSTSENPHPQLQEEKLRILLKQMADDIGYSDRIQIDDLGRIYYPNAIAQEEEIRRLRREATLREVRALSKPNAATDEIARRFPPVPGS